jgi:hypothetical protein
MLRNNSPFLYFEGLELDILRKLLCIFLSRSVLITPVCIREELGLYLKQASLSRYFVSLTTLL